MIWFAKSEQIEFLDFHDLSIDYMNDICMFLSEVNILNLLIFQKSAKFCYKY